MTRQRLLIECEEALLDKPWLGGVFTEAWRAHFSQRVNALPDGEWPSLPLAYLLPAKHELWPGFFPAGLQGGIDCALGQLLSQTSPRDKREFKRRLRSESDSAACEELLPAAAFGTEFGMASLKAPSAPRDQVRPEFFVETGSCRWAVECRRLEDNEQVRALNAKALHSGSSWAEFLDPTRDSMRLRRAIIEKLRNQQGGGPMVLLLSSHTPWLAPAEMETVVSGILGNPSASGLTQPQLPIAVACLSLTVVQGIWICAEACDAAGFEASVRERIRNAIGAGYVARSDGTRFSERE